MAENKKAVEQPGENAERKLISILRDDKDEVVVGKTKYHIGALKKGTRVKVTEILLEKESDVAYKESEAGGGVSNGSSGDDGAEIMGVSKDGAKDKPKNVRATGIKEDKVMAKIAAAYILNSWWSLYFLGGLVWSIYWRWFYYIRQYTDSDYIQLMILCKKKAEKQTAAYTNNITLATDMKMTTMMMTRAEVQSILQERTGDKHGAAPSAAKEG